MPEMYPEVFTVPLSEFSTGKPGQLAEEQVKRFFDEGFLVVPEFFQKEELNPVFDAINKLVDDLAEKLYAAGKIKNKHEDSAFYQRLSKLEQEFPGTAVLLHKGGILPKAFQALWSNDRLLNVVEQFIGPDIAGSPVWNLRTKTPNNPSVTVPWHQDNAYLSDDAAKVLIVTAWIPLLDANFQNGCMQVARGGHRKGLLAKHTCCAGPSWYVDLAEEEMVQTLGVDMEKDIVTCEIPLGGILFLNNVLPHRSLENFSDKIRWSLDLRWQKSSEPACFFNLKDPIVMRVKDDPNYKIDWDVFSKLDRSKIQENHYAKHEDQQVEEDEFDTRIVGPWMGKWEITHHNKHTDLFHSTKPSEQEWHKA